MKDEAMEVPATLPLSLKNGASRYLKWDVSYGTEPLSCYGITDDESELLCWDTIADVVRAENLIDWA